MNAQGFSDLKRLEVTAYQDPMVSPLASWYMRLMLRVGSPNRPDRQEERAAFALVRDLNASKNRTLRNSIWVDKTGTDYGGAEARTLRDVACVRTVFGRWDPFAQHPTDNGIGSSIKTWTDNAFEGDRVPDFLNQWWDQTWYGEYTFYGMTLFHDQARVTSQSTPKFPSRIVFPYYHRGLISGVRIDSTDMSLYVFLGSNQAVEMFRSSMDEASWKTIRTAFVPSYVVVQNLSLEFDSFVTLNATTARAFGTDTGAFSSPGLDEQAYVSLDADGITADVLAGARGWTPAPVGGTFMDAIPAGPVPPNQVFSPTRPMMYVVEDRVTGAIILAGIHVLAP